MTVGTRADSSSRKNLFWLVFIPAVVFVVYVLCPVTTSTDSRWTIYISMSMLREHDADLDEYAGLMEARDFRVVYLHNHIYSYFPLALPLIISPYVWAVDRIFELRRSTSLEAYLASHFPDATVSKIEKIGASFIAALAALVVFVLGSARLTRSHALLLTSIFAFSTPMLSTASRALWQHGISALCLASALWMLLYRSEQRRWAFLTGATLGLSYVVRPTNSISAIFLLFYVWMNRRRQTTFFVGGLLIPLAFLSLYSLRVYGAILPPYYQPERLGSNLQFFNAALGNLVSPNRGLFFSTPILLLSVVGMYVRARAGRMSLANLDPYLAAILVVHWLAISSFDNWYGGWSLGPRFLTDVMPYFAYFLIPILEGGWLRSVRARQIAFMFALVISALIHFRFSTSIYPFLWNGKPVAIVDAPDRVWAWSDLQVLRGLCEDRLEGRAPACWIGSGALE